MTPSMAISTTADVVAPTPCYSALGQRRNDRLRGASAGWTSRVSKILVIDDDGTVRAVLAALLGKFGHDAVLASNTIDGITAAESGSIDVALIDMNMPGLDGLEAVKAIARLEPRIPIVGMSAGSAVTSADDYAVLAAKLGADRFLPKPFDGTALQGVITAISTSRPPR